MAQEQKDRAKLLGWVSAGCALALVSACLSPRALFAEDASAKVSTSASSTRASKPKPKTKASHTKKSLRKSAASATTARRRSHPPSQLAADKQPLSTTATTKAKPRRGKTRGKKVRGQQKIDSERAVSIQTALIREHYLSGTATGTWNQSSEDAMRRYQADHGWQSKTVPDARALISLGLGPSQAHLLNPESAMTTGPSAPRAAALTPASHSAEPGSTMSAPVSNPNSEASRPQ